MARKKKTDAEKETRKATKDPAQELETAEQDENPAQEPETAGQDENPAQEPEAAEQDEDPAQEPELLELEQSAAKETVEVNQPNVQGPDVFTKPPDPFAYCLARLPNPCVYCGPSVKGVARQYTTYHGGIPNALREFVKEHPQALGLIVSVGRFQTMRKRLETRGTPEAELYTAVKARL